MQFRASMIKVSDRIENLYLEEEEKVQSSLCRYWEKHMQQQLDLPIKTIKSVLCGKFDCPRDQPPSIV